MACCKQTSLVQPHFDYCNVVWGNCSKNLSSKLQKLQNRASRVLTFSNYDCSTSELLRAQERPATLVLIVTSGLRITRARHVYNKDAETGN